MAKPTTIGTIRKTEKGSILVLSKGITIFKDGVQVSIDPTYKTLNLFDSTEGANRLAELGHLDTDQLAEKLAYIGEKNIIRDVVAYPAKA